LSWFCTLLQLQKRGHDYAQPCYAIYASKNIFANRRSSYYSHNVPVPRNVLYPLASETGQPLCYPRMIVGRHCHHSLCTKTFSYPAEVVHVLILSGLRIELASKIVHSEEQGRPPEQPKAETRNPATIILGQQPHLPHLPSSSSMSITHNPNP
jgi:hypothetical protein